MPVWKNASRGLLVLSTLGWLVPAAGAEFTVTDLQARLRPEALVLNGQVEFGLTPKVEEALSKGIELSMMIEMRLYRKRSLFWDERVASWSLRRSLQYHALSGQYLVGSGSASENFLSLPEALKFLGRLSEMRLPLPETEVDIESDYRVNARARLDIEALPAPLRPVAYTSLSWYLNSGWTTWNVAR